jgi:transposase-like protein
MPWKETCPMDERMQFVAEYLKDQWPVAQLCRQYGISRKTGYKWMTRYEAEGWPGIREHSRAPHMCPHETPEALQERLVQLRRQRPHWGPRKLRHRLAILEPETAWPAPSTAGDILKRHGLVATRRRRCRTRHERLHRTLKQATATPPRRTQREQQRAFEQFRHDYNHDRPHEALAMRTPAQCYTASPRAFPLRLPGVEYPACYQVRRVRSSGRAIGCF